MLTRNHAHFSKESNWRKEFKRLEGVYAPNTMRSYYADLEIFENWCAESGKSAFPASEETLCAFLEAQALSLSVSTVQRRLYAVRKAHRLLKLDDPTYSEDVALAYRRIKRAKFARPKQAKGLTKDILRQCIEIQPDSPIGLRNRAMLALGYEILARRSELVALRTEDLEVRQDNTFRVMIRRSKADPFGHGRMALTSVETARKLFEWLEWRGDHIDPLFCPIYHSKPINRSLGTTSVKNLVKNALRSVGLCEADVAEFSGHSMRVGAAQDLLCAGFDGAAIMRAGGWKSVNVLTRYLEQAEQNVWEL